jgi:hypothetical protein
MKNLYSIFLGIALIVFLSALVPFQVANLQGSWKSTTDNSEFILYLDQPSNNLTGSHCSVQQNGNRIDCRLDDTDLSISGRVNDATTVTVTFKSFSGGATGKATIKKVTPTTIEWTIIKKPQGEFYIPMNAVLTKF